MKSSDHSRRVGSQRLPEPPESFTNFSSLKVLRGISREPCQGHSLGVNATCGEGNVRSLRIAQAMRKRVVRKKGKFLEGTKKTFPACF